MAKDHIVKAFLTVEVKRKTWKPPADTHYGVAALRVSKVHKERPAAPADGEIVEIELRFPEGYFDHNTPKVAVVIPENAPTELDVVTYGEVKPRKPSSAAAVIQR